MPNSSWHNQISILRVYPPYTSERPAALRGDPAGSTQLWLEKGTRRVRGIGVMLVRETMGKDQRTCGIKGNCVK